MDVNVSKISHTTAQQEDDNFDICLRQLQNMNFTAKTGQPYKSVNYTAMGNAGSILVATGIFLFNILGSHGSEDVDLDF
jgi:hypothetical protein